MASNTTKIERILYITKDPTAQFRGVPLPALTTMMYRVCDNDPEKFNEATRLIELFIVEALKETSA